MERSEIITSREFEDDFPRPLERLGFGPAGFISDHRSIVPGSVAADFPARGARTAPNFAQPIILSYGTCASAKTPRHLAGAWLHRAKKNNVTLT